MARSFKPFKMPIDADIILKEWSLKCSSIEGRLVSKGETVRRLTNIPGVKDILFSDSIYKKEFRRR